MDDTLHSIGTQSAFQLSEISKMTIASIESGKNRLGRYEKLI